MRRSHADRAISRRYTGGALAVFGRTTLTDTHFVECAARAPGRAAAKAGVFFMAVPSDITFTRGSIVRSYANTERSGTRLAIALAIQCIVAAAL